MSELSKKFVGGNDVAEAAEKLARSI